MDGAVYCMHCSKRLSELNEENNYDMNQLSDVYYSYLNNSYNTNNSHPSNNTPTNASENNNMDYVHENQQENYFLINDEKTLFVSMLLAMIVPGFGLVYLKQVLLGVFIFLITIMLWILTGIFYYLLKIDLISVMLSISIIIYLASIAYTYKLISVENGENRII
ncbi:hypothetical protein AW729_10610 [Methanosphaera sp. BMS]|nr:hypothetical protein AW729_10610 [Methanosphaera sp. BMS]